MTVDERYIHEDNFNYYTSFRRDIDDLFSSEQHHLIPCLEESRSILDIGCASGGMAEIATSINPDIEYYGIDVDSRSIQYAKTQPTKPNVRFDHCDFLEMEISKRYELVLMLEIMFFFKNWPIVLSKLIDYSEKYVVFTNRVKLYGETSYDAEESYVPYFESGVKDPYYIFNISEFIEEICLNRRVRSLDVFGYNIKKIGNFSSMGDLGYKLPIPVKDIFATSFLIGLWYLLLPAASLLTTAPDILT